MQLTLLKGYPDLVGRRQIFAGYGNGPTSYNITTGDPVIIPGYEKYIDAVFSGISVSGTYRVDAGPAAAGARQPWALTWSVVSTGAEVANAVNLSAEVVQIGGFIGEY